MRIQRRPPRSEAGRSSLIPSHFSLLATRFSLLASILISRGLSYSSRPRHMPHQYTISADKMREVLEVSRLLAVTSDLDHLLMEIAKATQALLGAERASIFLY